MKSKRILLLLAVAGVAAVVLAPAQAKGPSHDDTTILVKFLTPSPDDANKIGAQGDEQIGQTKTQTRIVKVKGGRSVDDAIAQYEARPDVDYAEENAIASADLASPSDPSFDSQWALAKISALDAWSVFPGSYDVADGPVIGIVDSGVESTHPDLAGRVLTASGANCLSGTCVADPAADDYGHGTHVAGIAAADTNEGVGVAGLAFDAPILPVKVLDSSGNGSYASVANGIIWATDNGARVINLSLGSTAYSQTICDAASYAITHGSVVVAAAGNYGTSTPFYPAACPGVIGVGATDSTDTRASFSETGYPNVAVTAPGVGILSTYLGGSYQTDSGTSMAAPFVSAIAEMLVAQDSTRAAANVERILAASSDKVGGVTYGTDPSNLCACTWNAGYGYGRVNAYRALTTPEPPAAPDFSLYASPSTATASPGTSVSYTVSTSALNGFSGTASLSVSGLPSGATASFTPTSITGAGSSILKVTTATTSPPATYSLTVTATSGSLTRRATATLVIPGPDFALNLTSTSAAIYQTEIGSTSISLKNLSGFKSTVYLSFSGAPTGATTKLSRTSTSGTTAVTLTVTTTSSTPVGTYPITITGTSGSLVRTATYALSVAVPVPNFSLSITPISSSLTYGRATTITYKIGITPKFGFTGPVSFSLDATPAGMTGAWTASTVTVSSTSTVYAYYKLTVPSTALRSTSVMNFTGVGGSISRTISVSVKIA